jgi:hypothetical protein
MSMKIRIRQTTGGGVRRAVEGSSPIGAEADACAACDDTPITGVRPSWYPWTDNGFPCLQAHGLVANYGLLDAFAREFANNPQLTNTGEMRQFGAQMQDFFLVWLQSRQSNIVAGIESAPAPYELDVTTAEGLGTAQWLAHLMGYYASVWLRAQWIEFDGPRFANFSVLRDRVFSTIYRHELDPAREIALHGSDASALEFSRDLLRKNRPRRVTGHPVAQLLRIPKVTAKLYREPGEVGIFAFNAGFLHHILPPSLNSPVRAAPFAEPYYSGDTQQLFDAHFALPEQPFLTQARETFAVANSAGGEVAARLQEAIDGRPGEHALLWRQQNWDTVAAGLYRVGIPGGTVYRGFDQSQYDRLLAWTSYSVMHNVANGYNALSAYATGNAELARQQITARTLWWGFIYSYLLGASDRRHDGVGLSASLPRFTTVDHTTCQ